MTHWESTCLPGKLTVLPSQESSLQRETTMGDTQQPQPAGTGAAGAEAAAALAEIQRRQDHVIKAVLVPGWYWWAMAAGMVAIGAARDTGTWSCRPSRSRSPHS